MKLFISSILGAVLIFILPSCSGGLKTHSVKTKGVDFNKYKSYAWAKPTDEEDKVRRENKTFGGLILQLANEELIQQGLTLNTEQPDAIFLFDTEVLDQVSYSQTPRSDVGIGFGGPGYYGSLYTPVGVGDYVAHDYQQAMLFIEMYDGKTKKLLWKGWAENKITENTDIEKDIREAIKKIFTRMPLKHK